MISPQFVSLALSRSSSSSSSSSASHIFSSRAGLSSDSLTDDSSQEYGLHEPQAQDDHSSQSTASSPNRFHPSLHSPAKSSLATPEFAAPKVTREDSGYEAEGEGDRSSPLMFPHMRKSSSYRGMLELKAMDAEDADAEEPSEYGLGAGLPTSFTLSGLSNLSVESPSFPDEHAILVRDFTDSPFPLRAPPPSILDTPASPRILADDDLADISPMTPLPSPMVRPSWDLQKAVHTAAAAAPSPVHSPAKGDYFSLPVSSGKRESLTQPPSSPLSPSVKNNSPDLPSAKYKPLIGIGLGRPPAASSATGPRSFTSPSVASPLSPYADSPNSRSASVCSPHSIKNPKLNPMILRPRKDLPRRSLYAIPETSSPLLALSPKVSKNVKDYATNVATVTANPLGSPNAKVLTPPTPMNSPAYTSPSMLFKPDSDDLVRSSLLRSSHSLNKIAENGMKYLI